MGEVATKQVGGLQVTVGDSQGDTAFNRNILNGRMRVIDTKRML